MSKRNEDRRLVLRVSRAIRGVAGGVALVGRVGPDGSLRVSTVGDLAALKEHGWQLQAVRDESRNSQVPRTPERPQPAEAVCEELTTDYSATRVALKNMATGEELTFGDVRVTCAGYGLFRVSTWPHGELPLHDATVEIVKRQPAEEGE